LFEQIARSEDLEAALQSNEGTADGLALGSYVIWQHRRQTVTAFWAMGRAGIAVALCAALATICFINALSQTTVADVLVINATAPLMTAALAWLWTSERESKATIIASVAAFFGVTVTVSAALTEGHTLGDLLAVIMTVLYSATMIIIRANREISRSPCYQRHVCPHSCARLSSSQSRCRLLPEG
jgi:drug/metabolite transporter (DMT)-like permease